MSHTKLALIATLAVAAIVSIILMVSSIGMAFAG